jgi:hypothetical protein
MPRRTPPVPLSGTEQTRYDDLYDLFGKEDADKFALSVTESDIPYSEATPDIPGSPSVMLPAAAYVTPKAVPPIGMQPPSAPIPATREKLIDRPGIDEVRVKNEAAQVKRIDELGTMYKLSGMTYEAAMARARDEVIKGVEQPRTVEFASKPVRPGTASDFAARGVELAPRLDTARTVIEAFKPQVLESEQQAAGRKRFQADQQRADAMLRAEAAKSGLSVTDVANRMAANNATRALDIARQMYGDAATVAQIKQVEDTLNAPIYAASTELTKGVFAPLTEMPGKVLRGLTETEIRGQRVESQGAAALRGIGGISRVALGAAKEFVMDPLSKAAIAADEGISIQEVDARLQRDRAQQGGASQTVSVNPLGAPVAVGPRSRIDTGNWLKDTAYEIATGRSAVDDYVDLGVSPNLAVVAGVATEFALPITPIGWITDVAPAFGAAKALSKVGQIAGDAAKAPALNQFFADTARSAKDVGLVLEKPAAWKSFTQAADMRTKVATELATEISNVALLDKSVANASIVGAPNNKVVLVNDVDKLLSMPRNQLPPTSIRITDELLASGADLQNADEIIPVLKKILRGDAQNPGIVTKIKTVAPGNVQADIVRNTFAAAIKNPNTDAGFEATVRAAIAETLEKVPDNGWAFMTPTLIIKKTVMADKAFQTAIGDAVRALPDGASMTDVQKAIETTAKDFLKGKGSIAEPFATVPKRAESLLPSAPLGGLERLETPTSRRMPILEAKQDIEASVKGGVAAIADKIDFLRGNTNPAKRVSDAFAGSPYVSSLDNTLESALKTRMATTTRNMIEKTRSEIQALGMSRTSVATGAESGTVINAIRAQGGLDSYLTARIGSDISGNNTLKASTHTAPVRVQPLNSLPEAGRNHAITAIVNEFFGEGPKGLGVVISPDIQTRLSQIVAQQTASNGTAVEAITASIKQMRDEFPALSDVGRRSPGTLQDDVAGSALNYIIGSESKKIYADNFFEAYPELNPKLSTSNARKRFIEQMTEAGSDISIQEQNAALAKWDEYFDSEIIQKEFAELALQKTKEEFGNQAFEYSTFNYPLEDDSALGKLITAFVGPDISQGNIALKQAAMTAIHDVIIDDTSALVDFATMNKLVRPLNEKDVINVIAEGLRLPIGSTERAVFESVVGPLDDLVKGKSAISSNLEALRRNPASGMLASVSESMKSAINQVRSTSISGMIGGQWLPNPKFFANNYFGAGPMIAVTAPNVMAKTVAGEISNLTLGKVNIGGVGVHSVLRAAENPNIADNVAFVSKTGVPYTNKQLADFLNNNYFGMTEKDFALSNKIGEDIRIAIKSAPDGMTKSGLKDAAYRYMNINGTNVYSRLASQVDTNWRQQVFLNALKSGEMPTVAQRTAQNAIFDYGRIPAELRQGLSRYMTFMSFFAMSHAEVLGALFKPAAMKNIAKSIVIQRDLNRAYGEYEYADDSNKQRMYSKLLGQDDDRQPTFFVGPANPVLAPLMDDVQLVSAMYSIGADVKDVYGKEGIDAAVLKGGGAVLEGAVKTALEKMFTASSDYLEKIGVLGDKPMGMTVPWEQIYFHQAIGPEHFGEWMRTMGISAIPVEDRKIGVPEFNQQQYQYNDEKSRNKAAGLELVLVLAGANRNVTDLQKSFAVSGISIPGLEAPKGANLKRFGDSKPAFYMQYALGGNLKKGTPEYELYYQALKSEGFELNPK